MLHHHKCEDIFNRKQLPYPGTFLNWLKPGMMSPTHGIIFEESEDEDDKFKPASNPFSDKYHAAIAAAMAATPQREEVPDTMDESHTPRVSEMQPQPPNSSSLEDTGTDMEVDGTECRTFMANSSYRLTTIFSLIRGFASGQPFKLQNLQISK